MTPRGCIQPGEVTPEAIMAYVDGEAPAEVADHVRRCASCTAEVRDLGRFQRRLQLGLFRFNCPSPQLLGEYALDLVTPEARLEIARHVLECPRCTEELQSLRTFLAEAPVSQPVPGLVERVRRVVATLFTPVPTLAGAALRGAGDGGSRTYRAGELTITLGPGLQPSRGRLSLMGLIVHEAGELEVGPQSTAQLVAPGGEVATAVIDELGNFTFDDLAPGTYRLELHLPDQVVVIEDVPLEA